jgi:hypothetical protein
VIVVVADASPLIALQQIETEGDVALPDEAEDPTGWKAIDSLRGIVKDAPRDMAENHDKYLYGGFPTSY